jgi:hypothetical protein
MALKPEASIMAGLAVGAVVYGIHVNANPTMSDIRSLDKGNDDVAKSERVATATSAAIVAGISLIAKDPTIFVIGGVITIAMAWWTRHSNLVNPTTGVATVPKPADVGNTPSGVTQASPQAAVAINYGASVI